MSSTGTKQIRYPHIQRLKDIIFDNYVRLPPDIRDRTDGMVVKTVKRARSITRRVEVNMPRPEISYRRSARSLGVKIVKYTVLGPEGLKTEPRKRVKKVVK